MMKDLLRQKAGDDWLKKTHLASIVFGNHGKGVFSGMNRKEKKT